MRKYSKEDIEECRRIYNDYKKGATIEELEEKYHMSSSTIYRRIEKAKEYIENDYSEERIDDNYLEVMMPNAFIDGIFKLGVNSHKIFRKSIALYQSYKISEIPYSSMISDCPQLKNKKRIEGVIEELRNLEIITTDNEKIKIYEDINYVNYKIKYNFTEQALDYIVPTRYLYMILNRLL